MALHGKNILGSNTSAAGNDVSNAVNPATGERLEPGFHHATSDELTRSIKLAVESQTARTTGKERGALLRGIADEIMQLGEELIRRCSAETGLPEARIVSERGRTVNQLLMFAALVEEGSWVDARIDAALPDRKPVPKPDIRRMLIPIGPVAVFCASNFPLAFSVAGGDTASALAAGNPVIVKAHGSHPGTAELVGTAIQRAIKALGMPSGLFSLIHGPGQTVGHSLVTHPGIKAVGFTGSQKGGRALFDAASRRPDPIPVYAEMGSLNPVFLLPEALEKRGEEIAEGLTKSVTLGVGQFCTNPGLVFALESPDLDDFITTAGKLFSETQPATMLNAKICKEFTGGIDRMKSAKGVAIGGESRRDGSGIGNPGTPVLFKTDAASFRDNIELSAEVFGPATLIVAASSEAELHSLAVELQGHLTASVHGTGADLDRHKELVSLLETKAGRVIFNGFPTGVEVCPSMNHGGPYPAATDIHFTSVGTAAVYRFSRPICYQGFPDTALPVELQNANPLGIRRIVDGGLTDKPVS